VIAPAAERVDPVVTAPLRVVVEATVRMLEDTVPEVPMEPLRVAVRLEPLT